MIFNLIRQIFKKQSSIAYFKPYEMPEFFCPNCNADLEKQRGYNPEINFWVCKSCGATLTNPESDLFEESDIVWFCDGCGKCLNEQNGFSEENDVWKCICCGYENRIDPNEIYVNEEEFQQEQKNPTKGMQMEDLLKLSCYHEINTLDTSRKVSIVKDLRTDKLYVKKILELYDMDVIDELCNEPVPGMPRIVERFQSDHYLILIEEYVDGKTLEELLETTEISLEDVKNITLQLCDIVQSLHQKKPPIIHRDIKPANIILSPNGKVYLLDIDISKNYDESDREDTMLLGTKGYAAPEQWGFGASTTKTDIYAIGVLINFLLSGEYPHKYMVEGPFSDIVERCTKLEPKERYENVLELKKCIEKVQ